MNYRLTLQIIACVITAAILVGLSYGLKAVADNTSPDFVSGALFGGLFVGVFLGLAIWLDKKSASDTTRRR